MADTVSGTNAGDEALGLAAQTVRMILDRDRATLGDLRTALWKLNETVNMLPLTVSWPDGFEAPRDYATLRLSIGAQWPELGFYDEDTHLPGITEGTGSVGDAIDDLADLVDDLRSALMLVETDVEGANSWLAFHARSHWGYHVDHLVQHLERLMADQL